jgi:hypothetical protein
VTIYTFLYPIDQLHPTRAQIEDDLVRAGQGEGLGRVLRFRRAAAEQRATAKRRSRRRTTWARSSR